MSPVKEEKNMEKDLVEKRCLSDNRRYADLINGFVFQGKQILHETDLRELDTQTGSWEKRRFLEEKNHKAEISGFASEGRPGHQFCRDRGGEPGGSGLSDAA